MINVYDNLAPHEKYHLSTTVFLNDIATIKSLSMRRGILQKCVAYYVAALANDIRKSGLTGFQYEPELEQFVKLRCGPRPVPASETSSGVQSGGTY